MIVMDQIVHFCLILHYNFALFYFFICMFIVNFINLNVFQSCTMHSGVGKFESLYNVYL
jgi:hypothetical protein